ncbi:MAG: hypothetical protein IKT70_06255 [Clostridia bacterium]|nr:hypothetical protein [Clostridia bacterium]
MDRKENQKQHHFLFCIFSADKAENPMPQIRASGLLKYLRQVFKDSKKGS